MRKLVRSTDGLGCGSDPDVHLARPPELAVEIWSVTDSRSFFSFSAGSVEMTSSNLAEIRKSAISTYSALPPPTGDWPRLNVVGQPRIIGGGGDRMSPCGFGSKLALWQSPTDRNHLLPECRTFRLAHPSACFHPR